MATSCCDEASPKFQWISPLGDSGQQLPQPQLRRSRSDVSYADLMREERKARRRSGGAPRSFPPPLGSLARTSYSQCPNQVPWVCLQPIRSNGRIVLQEVNKIANQMSMQTTRSEGRLVVNLVRRGDENSHGMRRLPKAPPKPSPSPLESAMPLPSPPPPSSAAEEAAAPLPPASAAPALPSPLAAQPPPAVAAAARAEKSEESGATVQQKVCRPLVEETGDVSKALAIQEFLPAQKKENDAPAAAATAAATAAPTPPPASHALPAASADQVIKNLVSAPRLQSKKELSFLQFQCVRCGKEEEQHHNHIGGHHFSMMQCLRCGQEQEQQHQQHQQHQHHIGHHIGVLHYHHHQQHHHHRAMIWDQQNHFRCVTTSS